jgi:hypothetical protein
MSDLNLFVNSIIDEIYAMRGPIDVPRTEKATLCCIISSQLKEY